MSLLDSPIVGVVVSEKVEPRMIAQYVLGGLFSVYDRITVKVHRSTKTMDVEEWTQRGTERGRGGEYQKALRAFEKALSLDSEHIPAWNGKGTALLDLGDPEEALDAYERALDLDPEYVPAWDGKGNALLDLGDSEEALDAYERALDLDPEYVPVWDGKGNAFLKLGCPEEALDAYERALDLGPEYATTWDGKGSALLKLGCSEEALDAYERALDLDPEYVPAWDGKGNALLDLGDSEEALDAYERALDLDPGHDPAWNGKGGVLRDLGRPEEALDAYERALELNAEAAPYWYNKGAILSDDLDCPTVAHHSFLRVIHLADRASDFKNRRRATEKIPSILDRLQNTGVAPLLIISMVERHGLTDVYLRKPRAIGWAYEQSVPYQLLKAYFEPSPKSPSEKLRKHSLLGLAAFYLGDPFLAQKRHFSKIEELTDLFGPFYYGRTYQEYAKDEDADLIFKVSREDGEQILQQADRSEAVGPKKLYYAGQLFIAGSNPRWEQARECFERSAEEGSLPAKYMLALSLQELGEGQSDAHKKVVVSVLEEEKRRLDEQGEPGHEAGFLRGARLSDLPRSPEELSGEDESDPIKDVEQSLWRFAHAAEISDAVLHVYEWLEAQEEEKGQIPSEYAFVDLYDQPHTQHLWTLREQRIETLQEHFSKEDQGVDLKALQMSLDRYPNMPSEWIGSDASQIDPKRQEELLGVRISKDTSDERSAKYQELLTYLALKGRISARATLSLTAYLLATGPVSTAEVSDKIAESTAEAAITTGATELLEMAGVALGPFTSFSTTVAASLTAAFITDVAKEWSEQRLDYPTFREEFDTKLEGQSDEVYEQVVTMLERIRERQQ